MHSKQDFDNIIKDISTALLDGFTVSVCVQSNAGFIELHQPNGEPVNFPSKHKTIYESLSDAIHYAQYLHGKFNNNLTLH